MESWQWTVDNGKWTVDNGHCVNPFLVDLMILVKSFNSSWLSVMMDSDSAAVRYAVSRSRRSQYSVSFASFSAIASL